MTVELVLSGFGMVFGIVAVMEKSKRKKLEHEINCSNIIFETRNKKYKREVEEFLLVKCQLQNKLESLKATTKEWILEKENEIERLGVMVNSANIKNTQLEIELIELTNDRYDDAVDYAYEVNDFIDLVEELEEDS
ncbi:MAG: hypothetical protein ACRCZ1_00815, partial [Cetobacterium sp.]